MRRLLWLEDFNERGAAPAPEEEQEVTDIEQPAPPPPPDPRREAWVEGFMAGCRRNQHNSTHESQALAADLTRRLSDMEQRLEELANESATLVGGLLIDMLLAALPDDWPFGVAEKLREVIEAVRPVFALDPKLQINADPPAELAFRDLPGFYRALQDSPAIEWPLGIRWPSGDARGAIANLAAAITAPD